MREADIDDVDFLPVAEALIDWHKERINRLNLIVNSANDMKIVLQNDENDENSLTLEGRDAAIYKAGVLLCLSLFENFPLKIVETLVH
ncbi:hypothetical protein [Iodobacter sp. BJB302]|uniref:hypothetical protein n=1 Tax=Iodobacter sp. BJB302 TaxID=1506510 RepID=UPI000C0E7797|nr:hypothetical protein [Iodobacter sp. BJB302]PHV02821.1 hypothetical protein CSQ88_05260 [Iodobacter sp. BJB302]